MTQNAVVYIVVGKEEQKKHRIARSLIMYLVNKTIIRLRV